MNVYLDMQISYDLQSEQLISFACVPEEGQVFYAEFTDVNEDLCDNWTRHNVLDNLFLLSSRETSIECCVLGTRNTVKEKFAEWVSQFDDIKFISDTGHVDISIFGTLYCEALGLPIEESPMVYNINEDIAKYYNINHIEAVCLDREQLIKDFDIEVKGMRYNAWNEAEIIKTMYNRLRNSEAPKKPDDADS